MRDWLGSRVLAERAMLEGRFNQEMFEDLRADAPALEETLTGLPVPPLVTWGDGDCLLDVSGFSRPAAETRTCSCCERRLAF